MPLLRRTADYLLFESALFQTVSLLITGPDHLLLVDPTWLPGEVEEIAAAAGELAAGRERYLLFTHSDYDHIIGYGRFPGYRTLASAAFVANPEPDDPLRQIREFDDAYYVTRPYPTEYPRIDIPLPAAETNRRLGSDDYVFYPAPGHNPDGVITLNRTRGILAVGDYLSNVEFPYVYHSVAEYRATLDRLETIIESGVVRTLVPGHGDSTDDPAEMRRRLTESRAYLDELEESIRRGTPFDLDRLFTRYRFPGVMRTFHAGNEELMRQHVAAFPR
ncbi:MBL fold metallo-hydrolase [Lewinella sp. IMCC34183]|uniref:MBL fold metallo-hydrolase n=1 Tax=Lewinella sp. IMCC34183 TaxID=2248762 RepID=UPI000E263A81|nr:MBL fold metallo-hydrolase [Lewinella sp. IMCC34183]